jgi:hypothetical protein
VSDLAKGTAPAVIGARFHAGVAAGTAEACARLAEERGVDTVVVSGGVWQNRRLLERTTALLRERRLRVLTPERLPANDGGIAYGQVVVAAARGYAQSMSEQDDRQDDPLDISDPVEPLDSPEAGYPAGETQPYGGDVSHEQGTPAISGEEQDDERTAQPAAEDDAGVPPLEEHP